tara:strand:- start:301 stop:453 length:153 start_codon:yes stop_codon:yes gene_type:complete
MEVAREFPRNLIEFQSDDVLISDGTEGESSFADHPKLVAARHEEGEDLVL